MLQAAGLVLYVSLFASTVQQFGQWSMTRSVQVGPVLGITVFLLAFIISAIICSSIALAYPIFLFFGGKQKDAVKIVLSTLVWLIVFFIAFLIIGAIVFLRRV